METLVTLLVGLLGAAATVYGAKLQVRRGEEKDRAAEAKLAIAHPPPGQPVAVEAQKEGQVQVTLIFPGSSSFQDRHRTTYGNVSVHLDGQEIDSGPGDRGFKIEFTTTVGMHDLVFMWDRDREGFEFQGQHYEDRTYPHRSALEVVFTRPGVCIVRLGYWGRFRVRRFEPSSAGYTPLSGRSVGCLIVAGIGMIAVSGFVLWNLLR